MTIPKISILTIITIFCYTLSPAIGKTVWFRTDGRGNYPSATPPTTWTTTKNILWKTKMPSLTNATPIIIDNKIITCAEPSTVICLNRNNGKILWQTPCEAKNLLTGKEKQQLLAFADKAKTITTQSKKLNKQLRSISRKLRKDRNNTQLRQQLQQLKNKNRELNKQLQKYGKFIKPKTHKANGYTSATPVSDGKHIYAVFGTGYVVCLNMQGKIQWSKYLESPPHNTWGSCISPLLINNKLLVQYNQAWALDANTGKICWQTRVPWKWGTPVPAKISGENVIFTAMGDVIKVQDGTIVASHLSSLKFNSPVREKNNIYYIQDTPKAFTIPKTFPTNKQIKPIWQGSISKDRYYGTPVVHNGLIYAVTQKGILSVLDQTTGKTIYSKKLKLPRATYYPSITLAGKYLFISNEKGYTLVIKHGKTYQEITTNQLDPFRASPVFQDNKLYIRTHKYLYCIGK